MSSTKPLTRFRKAWLNWKSLHLPWRKRFLVGLDLQGNTFWEFRDTLSSQQHRMRRIVEYPRETHYSEVKISPQWHQWLKHVRADAPTIQEQSLDLVRQRNLKVLAAQADARWAAKGSLLDRPKGAPVQEKLERGPVADALSGEEREAVSVDKELERPRPLAGTRQTIAEGSVGQAQENKIPVEDPWKQARGGPSEEWQPKAWDGNIPAAKR